MDWSGEYDGHVGDQFTESHKSQLIENVLCCFKKFGYQAMSSN